MLHTQFVPRTAPRQVCTSLQTPALKRSLVRARIALDDDDIATRVRREDNVRVLTPELIRPECEKHVPWYAKPCNPAWRDVQDVAELLAAISKPDGKYKVVEFYAGWCSSCKGSFQALCKIPNDKKLAAGYEFYKANVEDESLFWWLKRNDIRGLPHMAVWSPTGELLLGTACNFKKMTQVKAALHTMLDNSASRRFGFNAQGVLEPLDVDVTN